MRKMSQSGRTTYQYFKYSHASKLFVYLLTIQGYAFCMLDIFYAFVVVWLSADFLKLTFSKNSFRNAIRVYNGLDPEQE